MSANAPKTNDSGEWIEKTLPTNLELIRETERDVLGRLRELGYDDDQRFAVRLAFEEALVNAMKHGNRMDPARNVRVAWRASAEVIEIHVADEGAGFDPACVPDPTADENLRRPCGRGIMLMRSYMDEVSYDCCGREVRMIKHRRPGSKS